MSAAAAEPGGAVAAATARARGNDMFRSSDFAGAAAAYSEALAAATKGAGAGSIAGLRRDDPCRSEADRKSVV